MPVIRFYDGSEEIYEHSISLKEILKYKNSNILQSLVAISINGNFSDLNTLIKEDSFIKFISNKDLDALNIIRYSCIQLLNYSIKTIWPSCKIAESKITSNGFYSDIDIKNRILEKDLISIEKRMKILLNRKYNILNKKVSFNEALNEFERRSEIYKVDLIKRKFFKNDIISLYYHENYVDFEQIC